mmetsp:Transcript_4871/g.7213  ORF Transcript_4871/g.7213 Transcript_4871/m.7213 type:complete len:239 (-) Transcript_4871:61-777(-)
MAPPALQKLKENASLQKLKDNASTQFQKVSSSVKSNPQLQKAASAVGLRPMGLQPVDSEDDSGGGFLSSAGSNNSGGSSSSSSSLEDLSDMCPKLTFQQRVIGFASCYGLGYLITFGSFGLFIRLVEGNPLPFVTMYTLGNILSLLSSVFLCGPKRQFKNMFDQKRRTTSMLYLSTLFLTIVVACLPFDSTIKLSILVLLLVTQICASLWYSLSYIPFGRRTAQRCLKKSLGLEEENV